MKNLKGKIINLLKSIFLKREELDLVKRRENVLTPVIEADRIIVQAFENKAHVLQVYADELFMQGLIQQAEEVTNMSRQYINRSNELLDGVDEYYRKQRRQR